ncbi:MAG: hypothetical protein JXB04_11150 [Kiritimatiellae bacterium]|nr:hypothetical protein [Kiritimatiellia bacterium]
MDETSQTSRREKAKRERAWDQRARWKVLQETMTWAERQRSARRNTPRACLAAEFRRLRHGS